VFLNSEGAEPHHKVHLRCTEHVYSFHERVLSQLCSHCFVSFVCFIVYLLTVSRVDRVRSIDRRMIMNEEQRRKNFERRNRLLPVLR
jgi:hypothetical protein